MALARVIARTQAREVERTGYTVIREPGVSQANAGGELTVVVQLSGTGEPPPHHVGCQGRLSCHNRARRLRAASGWCWRTPICDKTCCPTMLR